MCNIILEQSEDQKQTICFEILGALPEWFGIEEEIESYAKNARNYPMFVAEDEHGKAHGFISLKPQTEFAMEAYVLGVRKEHHGTGIGQKLFDVVQKYALENDYQYLTVKTLAASHPDFNYQKTRRFYEKLGFVPIEIFPDLWSPEHPCLLMVKLL